MRLIDADKFEADVLEHITVKAVSRMVAILEGQPTVEAIPIKHGYWVEESWNDTIICSNCGSKWNIIDNDTYTFNYCPHCGARMIEEWEKENETEID